MRIFQWAVDLWRARQRDIDLQVLWPACYRNARDIEHAKVAFFRHAMQDKAWACLGEDEVFSRVHGLTAPMRRRK